MFGINGGELLVLILIAIVVVGPERMPEYARQLREWVLGVRAAVDKGRAQLKAEVGDDVDWEKLDPRQYDPRRIVREALYEPAPTAAPVRSAPEATGQPAPFDADAT
ncbi:twin-arginine translocase TatA/TatE family subunit [Demequina sp. SO4-13]|uniref:twin-arginine translocase TatA/TatE family subunit n=1 Tax=Demequina sp. SO4-13 TaxID=3401027 RepID=UPI003AF66A01